MISLIKMLNSVIVYFSDIRYYQAFIQEQSEAIYKLKAKADINRIP